MNILLVDGNEKKASDRYKRLGMETQYEVYEKVLKKNSKSDINITNPILSKLPFSPKSLVLEFALIRFLLLFSEPSSFNKLIIRASISSIRFTYFK